MEWTQEAYRREWAAALPVCRDCHTQVQVSWRPTIDGEDCGWCLLKNAGQQSADEKADGA